MSLFDRIKKYDLQEKKEKKFYSRKPDVVIPDPWDIDSEKKILDAQQDPKLQTLDKSEKAKDKLLDKINSGSKKNTNPIKKKLYTKPDKPEFRKFFDPVKAKEKRDAFIAGRKAYTDSKTGIKAGKPTKKGIINYIAKARGLRQGVDPKSKEIQKAAEIIYKSSAEKYANRIKKRYETDLDMIGKRKKNASTFAQAKAKVDSTNPTYLSKTKTYGPRSGWQNRPLPLKKVKKIVKPKVTTFPSSPSHLKSPLPKSNQIYTPPAKELQKLTKSGFKKTTTGSFTKSGKTFGKLLTKSLKKMGPRGKLAAAVIGIGAAGYGMTRVGQNNNKNNNTMVPPIGFKPKEPRQYKFGISLGPGQTKNS